MKKAFFGVLVASVFFMQTAFAATLSSFSVQVTPTTVGMNQATDLTVKALDANGNVVQDFTDFIYMEIPEMDDPADVLLPSDGLYSFEAKDQGVKVFSKGLTLKKPGTYTVRISSIDDDSIKGEAKLTVTEKAPATSVAKITFSSPMANGMETNSTISVVGNAGVKNAQVQLYLNGSQVKTEQSSSNADFTSYITDLPAGQYTLSAKVTDVNGSVIAESDSITFSYQPLQAGVLTGLEITPSSTLRQGQKATFILHGVAEDITSVELELTATTGSSIKLPLDKMGDGVYQKTLLMDVAALYSIDASYVSAAGPQSATNIATLNVLEGKGIKEVAYIVDPVDPTKVTVAWKPIGSFDNVLVKYGMSKDDLKESQILTGSTGQLQGVDLHAADYYMRLFPADESGSIIGEPSDIILMEKIIGSAPVCRVTGIIVNTKKVGDQYFLVWDKADNAERYIVYRSDRPTSSVADMQKIGETSDTKFPYPFDAQAKTDTYAYYSVVAICQDGTSLQLGDTKKVKVGPMTNLAIVLGLTILIFGAYRMRRVSDQ